MRRTTIFCLMFALAFATLPGCASKYGEQKTAVNYYPACYQPIKDLRDREHTVAKSTAVGAGVGAASGALIGLLTTGKWQGALVGAVAGGISGTMVGNMYGRKQQEKDDNIRLASYLQDLDGDISNLDATSAAARTSLQCYDRQFEVLLGEIRSKQVTRPVAQQRFAEIQSGREEAIAILGNAWQQGNNLNQEYENAFASEEQQLKTPAKMAQQANYRKSTSTLKAARQRKQALTQKTAAIREEQTTAQNATASQTKQINEAIAELEDIRA